MRLKSIYQEIIKKGIKADVRSKKEIERYLGERKAAYEKIEKGKKEFFDLESLENPFADTRVLNGNLEDDITCVAVGIDMNEAELLLVDRLNEKGAKIDLALAHHPTGKALASLYEVMDLQADIYNDAGISISVCENLLKERKQEIERRIHSGNHQKVIDIAKWLKINLLCMHTPCDNLAHQYIKKIMEKNIPKTIADVVDVLYAIDEYRSSAKNNNGVMIEIGSPASRVKKIHVEFTGGTEGPSTIYDKLSSCGVDTIIAMHQSEEHFKKCKEQNINVIVAPHIASDNLGMNIMLDYLETKAKLKTYEFSGFRRFSHKAHR